VRQGRLEFYLEKKMSKVQALIAAAKDVLSQADALRSAEDQTAQLTAKISEFENRRDELAKEIAAAEVRLKLVQDEAGGIAGEAAMERADLARATAKMRAEQEREVAVARRETDIQVSKIRGEITQAEKILADTKDKHHALVAEISEIKRRLAG
jgi:chromosome segregation ATPase